MADGTATKRWRVIGTSVRGATHERTGVPNQDALSIPEDAHPALPFVAAVADGHGSVRSFRSDRGARFAVEAGCNVLRTFLGGKWEGANTSVVKQVAEERLPREILRDWLRLVENDMAAEPFTAEELAIHARPAGSLPDAAANNGHLLAYGSTLLAAVVCDEFLLFLQLGDGDILSVAHSGDVSRPVPSDERLIANETTSLCGPKPLADFRTAFVPTAGGLPALIMLSTDGYANSFRDDAGFRKVATDLLEIVRTEGPDSISKSLPEWLRESSKTGSGDDITVVLLYPPTPDEVRTTAPDRSRDVMETELGKSDGAVPTDVLAGDATEEPKVTQQDGDS